MSDDDVPNDGWTEQLLGEAQAQVKLLDEELAAARAEVARLTTWVEVTDVVIVNEDYADWLVPCDCIVTDEEQVPEIRYRGERLRLWNTGTRYLPITLPRAEK